MLIETMRGRNYQLSNGTAIRCLRAVKRELPGRSASITSHHLSTSDCRRPTSPLTALTGISSHFIKTGEWKVPPIIDGFKMFFGPVQCAAVSDARFRYEGVCVSDGVFWCYCDTDYKINLPRKQSQLSVDRP